MLSGSPAAGPTQITPEMRARRAEGLAVRRETYARSRIEDQRRWYMSKAAYNDQRFRLWMTITLILEVAGIGAGLVKAFGLLAFTGDLLRTGDLLGTSTMQ